MTTEPDEGLEAPPSTPLRVRSSRIDEAMERLAKFEEVVVRLRITLALVAAVALVAASGWWLASRDQDATVRNGKVADCRAVELARTLDQFQVIVAPSSTKAQEDEAARRLEQLGPLEDRYRECGAP